MDGESDQNIVDIFHFDQPEQLLLEARCPAFSSISPSVSDSNALGFHRQVSFEHQIILLLPLNFLRSICPVRDYSHPPIHVPHRRVDHFRHRRQSHWEEFYHYWWRPKYDRPSLNRKFQISSSSLSRCTCSLTSLFRHSCIFDTVQSLNTLTILNILRGSRRLTSSSQLTSTGKISFGDISLYKAYIIEDGSDECSRPSAWPISCVATIRKLIP